MSFFSSFLRGENSTDDAWKDHPWFPVSTMAPQPHPYYDDPDLFPPPKDPIAPPKTWVVQHLKEPRFGIGYLLSTGAVSVSFNDRTNIVLSNETSNFEYIEQSKHSSSSSTTTTPKRHAHTLNNFPDHLKKKVSLVGQFKKHLHNNDNHQETDMNTQKRSTTTDTTAKKSDPACVAVGNGMTYVKKCIKTDQCLLFRLSDESDQVVFGDKTEIILSKEVICYTEMVTLTYVDKQNNRTSYSLRDVKKSNDSHILKRLKYYELLISGKLANRSSSRNGTNNKKPLRIKILGLAGKGEQYNGSTGTVQSKTRDGRFNVQIDGVKGVKSLKRENIQEIKGTARTSSSVEGDDISSRSAVKRSAPSFSKK